MITIAIKKGNKIQFGSCNKVAKVLGIHYTTISNWIKAKEKVKFKNGYEVYLDTERL